MGTKVIKMRLLEVDKKQKDLLFELRKRGYPNLQQPAFNAFINGQITTPLADEVLNVANVILTEWENRNN